MSVLGAVRGAALAVGLVASGGAAPAEPAAPRATDEPAEASARAPPGIEPPARSVGLTVGDVLVQRVALASGESVGAPPPVGRVDRWLERHASRAVDLPGGGRALELRYQVVNSPEAPTVAALPALALELRAGGAVRAVALDPWPIAIGPLVAPAELARGAFAEPRPDRLTAAPDAGPARRRLAAWTGALAALGALWIGWWARRTVRDRERLPFARARRALAALPRAGRDERSEAWTALHRAFDRTAGGTVHAGSIDALERAAPWLAPWRARIERFYQASTERFFVDPPRPVGHAVESLCRELERAERRAAR